MDWILAAVGDGLLLWAFLLAWRCRVKMMSVLLGYILTESIVLQTMLLAGADMQVYARVYYWPGIVQGLLIAAVALEIGADLVPDRRAIVFRFGPAVLALSAFVSLAMGDSLQLAIICTRLTELSILGSVALVSICIAAGEANAPGGRLAKSYVFMLCLTCGASEMLAQSGMIGTSQLLAPTVAAQVARRIVPASWVIGTAVLVWALRGKQNRRQPVAETRF